MQQSQLHMYMTTPTVARRPIADCPVRGNSNNCMPRRLGVRSGCIGSTVPKDRRSFRLQSVLFLRPGRITDSGRFACIHAPCSASSDVLFSCAVARQWHKLTSASRIKVSETPQRTLRRIDTTASPIAAARQWHRLPSISRIKGSRTTQRTQLRKDAMVDARKSLGRARFGAPLPARNMGIKGITCFYYMQRVYVRSLSWAQLRANEATRKRWRVHRCHLSRAYC